ncbi:MAG: carbamoyltransferase [Promethearchaeota archaeon]
MPIVLGFHDSAFDSGATLLKDGEPIAAIHEERLCRLKHSGGFPFESIKKILTISKIHPSELDAVAVGFINPNFIIQLMQTFFNANANLNPLKSRIDRYKMLAVEKYEFLKNHSGFRIFNTSLSNKLHTVMLKKLGINKKIISVDHHLCHAASAYFSSGFKKCLVITADARGDRISTSINIADENGIKRISSSPESASMGHFYGCITEVLGFGYSDGEGKTEALAAFGNPSKAYKKLKSYIYVKSLVLKGKMDPYRRLMSIPFFQILNNFRKEDIAYAAQRILEEIYIKLIRNAIDKTGIKNIALAGGIFLNVKLNKKIMEMPEVKNIFIHPAAGDSGIPTGAAFVVYSKLYGLKSKKWNHVYLGNSYRESEIKEFLKKKNLDYEYIDDISGYIGEEILPKNYLIGWFQNKMEYGPRALGARSVLIDPRRNESPKKVNSCIKKRPAFQPFCPSILTDDTKKYIDNPKNIDGSFMILAFDAKQRMIEEAPAVVFIDSTSRIQTVDRKYNNRYYDLIRSFGKETGVPILLNTSFNRSGEPIVCTLEDAVNDFKLTKLDALVIGHYFIKKKN